MLEQAVICSIEHDKVKVVINHGCTGTCHECSSKGKSREFYVRNSNNLNIKKGDNVEIFVPPGKVILSGFLLFIVPLLLFLLFYYISRFLLNSNNDIIPGIFGILGLASGFLINIIIKKTRKDSDLPEIIKIVTEGE